MVILVKLYKISSNRLYTVNQDFLTWLSLGYRTDYNVQYFYTKKDALQHKEINVLAVYMEKRQHAN